MTLSLDHISLIRDGRLLISELDLRLEPGELCYLRGPNGVGKSSLLRAIAGLLPLSFGEITLNRVSLSANRDDYQSQISYCGHQEALKPQFSVGETMQFWQSLLGGDAERALTAMNLQSLSGKLVGYLSAGQKRRLALARSILNDVPLWIMDEPTVGLDTASLALFRTVLEQHSARGGMALIATHIDIGIDGRLLTLTTPAPKPDDHIADPFAGGWA